MRSVGVTHVHCGVLQEPNNLLTRARPPSSQKVLGGFFSKHKGYKNAEQKIT
jgi:hypothetical protein